jgi:hypothetical protein
VARNPFGDTEKRCSHAPRVGVGEPGTAAVWKARQPRPELTTTDRIFWIGLSRLWTNWRHSLQVVRPETVVRWHRQGFRRYWAWKSRRRRGRPVIRTEVRELIWQMSRANPLWRRAADPRRAAEAGPDGLPGDGFEVYVSVSAAAVAGVANVFKESRAGSDRAGLLHGAYGDLSSPVCADRADPLPASAGAFRQAAVGAVVADELRKVSE